MSGGFSHPPNMAPGIMGPGGPLVPLDMGPGAMSLHPMGRGFMGPLGGMPLPHGVSVCFPTCAELNFVHLLLMFPCLTLPH